ncbi:MAG: HAMP domain-containing histidine kinase, partial [Clostridia bacterium]|nr:HAMP domain-containing histidine kinase [Clostridia bacterium]
MKKAEKKFALTAALALLALLAVILGIINVLNFTMAAEDADRITLRIAAGQGALSRKGDEKEGWRQGPLGPVGPMGPDSPELSKTIRYFTVSVSKKGKTEVVAFELSAVDEEEAAAWAKELASSGTGWTRGTYRYRVYEIDGKTYVTVVDQGRELLSAYRILFFSLCGTAIGVAAGYIVLRLTGRRIFAPLEEADRKQKQFIAQAEKGFKVPLTVISAACEILEERTGPSEETGVIRRQIGRMDAEVRKLGTLAVFENEKTMKELFSLSELAEETADRFRPALEERGLLLKTGIQPEVAFRGDREAFRGMLSELFENAVKYAEKEASFTLAKEGERIRIVAENPASLPDGTADQVFDRFAVL